MGFTNSYLGGTTLYDSGEEPRNVGNNESSIIDHRNIN